MLNELFDKSKEIAEAADLLKLGKVVAVPTETVYGLAANAFDARAVVQIFEIKNRPTFDPLIVHAPSYERMQDFVGEIPEAAQLLARAFWPGPLTLLLPKRANIPDVVTAGSACVAVRVPAHPLMLSLLEKLPFPLAAPSANPFGYVSPTCAEHVAAHFEGKIAYILDGGPCKIGVESTIVGFPPEGITIYRQGGLPQEEIEKIVGPVIAMECSTSAPGKSGLIAPGTTTCHYAPRTPLVLGDLPALVRRRTTDNFGILAFAYPTPGVAPVRQMLLAPGGKLSEAAQNLFATMRCLDEQGYDLIFAEQVPNVGLGRAINDRLRRAAAQTVGVF